MKDFFVSSACNCQIISTSIVICISITTVYFTCCCCLAFLGSHWRIYLLPAFHYKLLKTEVVVVVVVVVNSSTSTVLVRIILSAPILKIFYFCLYYSREIGIIILFILL
jgi:hypothetical protein